MSIWSDDEMPLGDLYFTVYEEVEKNPRVFSEFLDDLYKPPSSGVSKSDDKDLASSSGTKPWSDFDIPRKKAKQARERLDNNLDPGIKRGPWTQQEDSILSKAHEHYGNKWTSISRLIPGRTDNAVKNRYYSALKGKKESLSDDKGEKESLSDDKGKKESISDEKGKKESLSDDKDYASSEFDISSVLMSPMSPAMVFPLDFLPPIDLDFPPREFWKGQ